MTTEPRPATTERSPVPGYVAAGLAMVAMAVIGIFYLSSGLVAPLWAVVGLVMVWAALVVIGIAWFRRHPLRVLALPMIAVLIWFAVLTLGERLLAGQRDRADSARERSKCDAAVMVNGVPTR